MRCVPVGAYYVTMLPLPATLHPRADTLRRFGRSGSAQCDRALRRTSSFTRKASDGVMTRRALAVLTDAWLQTRIVPTKPQ